MITNDMALFLFCTFLVLAVLIVFITILWPMVRHWRQRTVVAEAVRQREATVVRQRRERWTHPPVFGIGEEHAS